MELKGDDMDVLPCDMRCHALVYAVYGCMICKINAVSNVIQWFLSVSNTKPHEIFDMPFSKPIANWVQLSVWSYPQCTLGNYQIVIVTFAISGYQPSHLCQKHCV